MWTGGVVSVVSLIAIAFERYFAVLYPYDEKRRISKAKLKWIIPACWMFAVIWNLPLFVLVKYDQAIDFCYEDWPAGWYMNAYSLGWLIVFGIITLSIMVFLYTRVVIKLWVKTSQPVELTQAGHENGTHSDNCVRDLLASKPDCLCVGLLRIELPRWSSTYNNGSPGDFKFVRESDYLLFPEQAFQKLCKVVALFSLFTATNGNGRTQKYPDKQCRE